MGIRVYVAGPLNSSGLVTENVRKAVQAGIALMSLGYVPFVPHVNVLMEMIAPRSEAEWVAWDLQWLDACDILLRLPGYSVHSDKEVEFAERKRIPVFHSIDDIENAYGGMKHLPVYRTRMEVEG